MPDEEQINWTYPLTALPEELVLEILGQSDTADILRWRQVSRLVGRIGMSAIFDRLRELADRTPQLPSDYLQAAKDIYEFVLPADKTLRQENFQELDSYGPGSHKIFRCVIPLMAAIPEKQADFKEAILSFPNDHRYAANLIGDFSLFSHCIDEDHISPIIDKSIDVLRLSAQNPDRTYPYLYEAVRGLEIRMNPSQASAFSEFTDPNVDRKSYRPTSYYQTTTHNLEKKHFYNERILLEISRLKDPGVSIMLQNRVSALSDISDEIFKHYDLGRRADVIKSFYTRGTEAARSSETPSEDCVSTTVANSSSSFRSRAAGHQELIEQPKTLNDPDMDELVNKLEKWKPHSTRSSLYQERSRDRSGSLADN